MTSQQDLPNGAHTIVCHRCDEPLDGWGHVVRSGKWLITDQRFDGTVQKHYCEECYRERYGREPAAYYDVEDAERLWAILAASDGRLVASLGPIRFGSDPQVRVVDGELRGVTARMVESDHPEYDVTTELVRIVDLDYDRLEEILTASLNRDSPTVVKLFPVEETMFPELDDEPAPDIDAEQARLDGAGPDLPGVGEDAD